MQRHPAVDEQQKVNTKMGTDWEEILEQIDKTTVPTAFVKKVEFYYHGYSAPMVLYIDHDDVDVITALGPLISTVQTDRLSIQLDIDTARMSRMISQAVKPMLDLIPKSK